MNRKILIAMGIVACLTVGAALSEAYAACEAKPMQTINTASGVYKALVFPAGVDKAIGGGVLKGRFWQSGNRAAGNEGPAGACPEAAYMLDEATGPGTIGILGAMGGNIIGTDCINDGCPVGSMVLLVQTLSTDGTKAYYAVGKANETDGFDYSRGNVDWPLVEVSRPKVTASTRPVAGTVRLNLVFDPPTGARGESDAFAPESILTGYQLVRFEGLGDPGRAAAAWQTLGAVIPVTGTGATVSAVDVTCAGTTNDVFIATRPVFDGGQQLGDYVSASTRIECDPNLAEPRFKMIDKSKSGRGTIRPN